MATSSKAPAFGLVTESLLPSHDDGDADALQDTDQWKIKACDFPSFSRPPPLHPRTPFTSCFSPFDRRSGLDKYYAQQEEILKEFYELDSLVENGAQENAQQVQDEREALAKKETFAIRASNYANIVLFAAKVFVCVKSGSLAIIASTLDSLLDLLSGFILWFTAHSMKRANPYLYPIGKNRMQPVGILVFASVMATLGLQILLESGRRLISQDKSVDLSGDKRAWVIGIMVAVTAVKFVLMFLCRVHKNEILRAYAKDHFFDVITNIIGLAAALLAAQFVWWIDPAGAIVLAVYTIWNWSLTVLENVKSLVGETASPDFLKKLTYLCWNHHQGVKQIDTVRAYTFGGHYFVEVDIVLPSNMPLKDAHDIGESLQNKLELLPDVERAFVHLDYEVSHRPEHAGQV